MDIWQKRLVWCADSGHESSRISRCLGFRGPQGPLCKGFSVEGEDFDQVQEVMQLGNLGFWGLGFRV